MKQVLSLAVLLIVPFTGLREQLRKVNLRGAPPSNLEQKLDQRVERFDTAGRTFASCIIELAYTYGLPAAIEYADRDAARRRLNLKFQDESIRGILDVLVQQTPEYRADFGEGLVDVYSPRARADSSNVLNRVIGDFAVTEKETREADFWLFCDLAWKLNKGPCGGSLATGQWEPTRITLHLQNAKVYDVINAIVAENGKAIWTVTAPPDRMSKIQNGGSWYISPLECPFQADAVQRLERAAR